jgi:hypothetical protein
MYSAGDRVFTGKPLMLNMKVVLVCNLRTKGFDLSTDFVFKQGNYTYNYMWSNMNADGNAPTRNQAVNALDYWTATNTTASRPVPRQLSGINSNVESDRYLEDASYIRFRNLNIGYKFTKKTYNGLPVDEIRIYTQMQNLFTWTKFNGDPESVVQRVKLIC